MKVDSIATMSGLPKGDMYNVYQITYGRQPNRRSHQAFTRPVKDIPMSLEYPMWLLVNADRVILVDTAMKKRHFGQVGTTGHSTGVVRDWLIDPIKALKSLGIPAETIQHVIFTHLHGDHAGFVRPFTNAKFYIQPEEFAFATSRAVLEDSIGGAYNGDDLIEVVEGFYEHKLVFCEPEQTLFPGVEVFLLPGHSAGLQVVRANTKRGKVLLASDAAHYYGNLALEEAFPIYTGDRDQIMPNGLKALALAGGFDNIIPGHDAQVIANYPLVEINGVKMNALHEEPIKIDPEEIRASLTL